MFIKRFKFSFNIVIDSLFRKRYIFRDIENYREFRKYI